MNKELGCRKELSPYTLCGDIGFNNKILLCKDCETPVKTHEEFVNEVAEKTKPLIVPEESEECMKEGYEHDPKVRGPRSRPEYDRRKNSPKIIKHCKRGSQQKTVEGNDSRVSGAPQSTPKQDVLMFSESERVHNNIERDEGVGHSLSHVQINDANCEGDEKDGK